MQGKITLCETRTVCEGDIYLGPMSLPYIPETTPLLGPPAIEEVDTTAVEEANAAQVETPPASIATLNFLERLSEELIQFYYNKIQAKEAQRQKQQPIPITEDIYGDPIIQTPPCSPATISGEFYVEFPVIQEVLNDPGQDTTPLNLPILLPSSKPLPVPLPQDTCPSGFANPNTAPTIIACTPPMPLMFTVEQFSTWMNDVGYRNDLLHETHGKVCRNI